MIRFFASIALAFMLTVVSAVVLSGPIYTWYDETGGVHFSDQPQTDQQETSRLELQTESPSMIQSSAGQPYSIQQQIEYFDERRDAQREARLEEQKLRQERREQQLEAQRLDQLERQLQLQQQEQQPVYVTPYSWAQRGYTSVARPSSEKQRQQRDGDSLEETEKKEGAKSPSTSSAQKYRFYPYDRGVAPQSYYPQAAPVYPYPSGGYQLQYQHTGDNHRFGLSVGNPYPYYPVWNY